jgi:NAD(P)-dependent dehydrogenase (short-subunit alcohol dehydrogenase family)
MNNNIFDLTNKVAIITGGTGWLGFNFAKILAQYNASIIITTRDLNKGKEVLNKLNKSCKTQKHYCLSIDINDSEEVIKDKFDNIVKIYNKIDILINNAVRFINKDIFNINLDEFNTYQKQNGFYFYLSKLVRDLTIINKSYSSIVNIGSMYGLVSSYPEIYNYDDVETASSIAYHTLKGGLINMTKHMAIYWAKDNVRVNCLSPGAFPKTTIKDSFKKRLEKKIPLGRIGEPNELEGPILLLVSDASSYMTGHNLIVDGGWTVQ